MRIVIIGIITICSLAISSCRDASQSIFKGQKIYEEGILSNGDQLRVQGADRAELSGALISCAQCHRKSGFGTTEGNVFVPPIVSQFLFKDYLVQRKDMIRSLFQEEYNLQDAAKIRQLEERPAYDFHSLKRLLTKGITVDGSQVNPIMPRYEIGDRDVEYLTSYLKSLNAETSPGVSSDTLHFASIVTDDASEEDIAVFIELINTYVEWKNRNVLAQKKAAEGPEFHRGAFRGTFQNWKIHLWKMHGDSSSWFDQIDHLYEEQPVFAFLSGLSNYSWGPMHRFAEMHRIPSIFPNTQMPQLEEEDYNLYFTKGVRQEMQVIADYLKGLSKNFLILTDSSKISKVVVDDLAEALDDLHDLTILSVDDVGKKGRLDNFVKRAESDTSYVILAIDQSSFDQFCGSKFVKRKEWTWVLHSALALPEDHCLSMSKLVYTTQYRLEERDSPRNHRIHAWMRSRGVAITNEILQLNTYFALSVADFALGHMIGHYSREYFIEKIEHETENNLSPGIYESMSLGPGQRFAVKQVKLINRTETGQLISL